MLVFMIEFHYIQNPKFANLNNIGQLNSLKKYYSFNFVDLWESTD